MDGRLLAARLRLGTSRGPTRVIRSTTCSPTRSMSVMPGQRMREIRALRKAYAQSMPDTARLHDARRRDWMRGDTHRRALRQRRPRADTEPAPDAALIVAGQRAVLLPDRTQGFNGVVGPDDQLREGAATIAIPFVNRRGADGHVTDQAERRVRSSRRSTGRTDTPGAAPGRAAHGRPAATVDSSAS